MTTLSLCMIVKNESKIIEKCLNSIVDYLDYWVICETGSMDGAQSVIKKYFEKKVFLVNYVKINE
jgi:glycosyltransferase involved in cell wall biosynthesis